MRLARLIGMGGLILWGAALASGQTLERADLRGTVYDPKQAVIAGANLVLK